VPIPPPGSPTETPHPVAPRGAPARIALALVVVLYLATRLWRLTALPMFFDEATHLLWGERWTGSQGLARALAAGKLLHVAAVGVALRLVPDPLWAGRLATVVVGCAGLAGAFALGRRVGGFAAGLQTVALVAACPFLLFHDRMALGDGFVSASAAIVLAVAVRLCDAARPARGVVLGLALAAAGAAKILGLIVWVYPLVAVALLAPRDGRAWRALALAWGLAGALLVVPLGAFLARSGEIESKAALVVANRLALATRNLSLAAEWLWPYCTPGLAVVGLVATAVALVRRRPVELLLVFAWTFPLAVFVLGAAVWYPRYVVFATVPFLVLAAGLLAEMQSRARGRVARAGALAVTAAVFVPAVGWDARLLREPSSARLPEVDRWQYVEGWASGYGWRESHELLARERDASGRPLRVVTERLHWTLKAYFIGDRNVTVKGFDYDDPSWAERARTWVGTGQGWLVTSGPAPPDPPPGFALRHAAAFTKPGGGRAVTVYRLEALSAGPAP
jgi:hypothetical protein